MNFTVEYKERERKTIDDVSCVVIGSDEVGSRPDAVVQYLLSEKAGLPVSKMGSIYRDIPDWDDTDTWVDTASWDDEGQVSGVPSGAAFEEAGAWFDFNDYSIDGVLSGDLSVKDAIEAITFQTRSKLTWQGGKAKLAVLRNTDEWLVAKDIPTSSIQLKSFELTKSETESIVNKIDLFHTVDRISEASGSAQYTATAYDSDHASIVKHGEKVDPERWLFDLVRKQAMAVHIVEYYLWLLGEPATYYTLNAYLDNLDIEKEDYVTITSETMANVRGLATTVKEVQRVFGSGKNNQINLLKFVCQSIRHRFYAVPEESEVGVKDTLDIDFEFESEFDEPVLVGDILDIVEGRELSNDVGIGENFEIFADFNPAHLHEAKAESEMATHFELELADAFSAEEVLSIVGEVCFGSGLFGGQIVDGECSLPFGAKTVHTGTPLDGVGLSESMSCGINNSEESEAEVSDNLVFSECFGCASGIGSGMGRTPFGDV